MRATAIKQILRHVRLGIAVLAAIAVTVLVPPQWSGPSRLLLCWNAGVLVFLALTWLQILRMSGDDLRDAYEDEGTAWAILLMVTLAALLSLVAIVAMLANLEQAAPHQRIAHLVLAFVTVVDSWVLVPTVFALHYADMYYSGSAQPRPLEFPDTPSPGVWDFLYFSFTIAVACQTADVSTRNAWMRRAVLGHSVVSFVFNIAILGFAINVSAGLLGH